ncbi:MAG TPA: hypothetical protein VGH46_11510 [Gaiellaceae bacterium]|jgi:hypothetical protein
MAVTDEKDGALATVAVAAAAGAGVYALRKALASSGSSNALARRNGDGDSDGGENGNGNGGGSRSALLDTVWESASDAVVPMAEEAADAAGKWLAENAPDIVRERIIPRFIESFNEAA